VQGRKKIAKMRFRDRQNIAPLFSNLQLFISLLQFKAAAPETQRCFNMSIFSGYFFEQKSCQV